jgi:hypothetical protein
MNTQLQTTIVPKFVNPPRGNARSWSIKDEAGAFWGLPAHLSNRVQPGQPIHVSYDEKHVNGKTYRDIRELSPAGGMAPQPQQQYAPPPSAPQAPAAQQPYRPAPAPAQTNGNGNGYYRPTSPVDAERMFVCGAVNAAIQGGQLPIDAPAVEAAVNAMRQAWAATFGADNHQP